MRSVLRTCEISVLLAMAIALILTTGAPRTSLAEEMQSHRFPDFNAKYLPPEVEYDGPLFRLSQNYPDKSEVDQATREILAIPFDQNTESKNWLKYLLAVRAYCLDGNTEVEWRGQENRTRLWYHVPWQHAGEKGREGINGLTREATAQPKQLSPLQKDKFQTHAVALYNNPGGYTIGQVWKDQFQPNPTKAVFPVGTVVVKVLFTQADEKQVPYLINPITWKGYIQDPAFPTDPTKRKVQDLRLIQMDIMVRDDRAKATGGWVFGTYCYNGALKNENPWENLMPVGIQWGNDPDLLNPDENPTNPEPTSTQINNKLKQTIINPSPDLPPQHLGWGGRLNGPADYYRSSCMSCHSTAQYPSFVNQHPDFDKPIKYRPGDPQWDAWFRNLKCGDPFNPMVPMLKYDKRKAISTDFSLQLSIGITHFYAWKSEVMGGYFTPALPGSQGLLNRETTTLPTSEPPVSPQR